MDQWFQSAADGVAGVFNTVSHVVQRELVSLDKQFETPESADEGKVTAVASAGAEEVRTHTLVPPERRTSSAQLQTPTSLMRFLPIMGSTGLLQKKLDDAQNEAIVSLAAPVTHRST